MNTLSVSSALKRTYFKIQGEADTLPFVLTNVDGHFYKSVAPVDYTVFDKDGNRVYHSQPQNIEYWVKELPVGSKIIIPHFENKAIASFEVFKHETEGYWRTGVVEITPDMLDI